MNNRVRNTIMWLGRSAAVMALLLATSMPVSTLWADWGDSFSITFTPVASLAPNAVTDLSAVNTANESFINIIWTAPSVPTPVPGAVASYEVRAATFSVDSLLNDTTAWWNAATVSNSFPESVLPGTTESFLIGNLAVSNTWYFAITSRSPGGKFSLIDEKAAAPGSQAYVFTSDVQPVPPTGLQVIPSTSPVVVLKWDDMKAQRGYVDFDYYRVYRSTNASPFSAFFPIGASTGTVFIDGLVSAGATYYYCVTAADKPPQVLVSTPSATVTACVTLPPRQKVDLTIPLPPSGVKLSVSNYHPVINFNAPLFNTDGTPCMDLDKCEIYRATDIHADWDAVGFAPCGAGAAGQWIDTGINLKNSAIYYYKVESVDASGNTSADSMICDTSVDLNVIAVSSDKQLYAVVPQSEAAALYRNSSRNDDVDIVVNSLDVPGVSQLITAGEFNAVNATTRQKISGFQFDRSTVKVVWKYGLNPMLKSNAAAHTPVDIDKELSIFWNNGVEWIKLSKVMNTDSAQVTVKHLGKFMIKQSLKAENFTLTKVYPQIFTPNGDNRNDYVVFQFENPKDDDVSGKIYDIRGAYISALTKAADNASLIWDGTKDGGKVAEPGAYVYQIEVIGSDAKVINGVIILAK